VQEGWNSNTLARMGLTQEDIDGMPPTIVRGFSLDNNFKEDRRLPELGVEIGPVKLDDGSTIEGGKVLMRGEWNSEFYSTLAQEAREVISTSGRTVYLDSGVGLRSNGCWRSATSGH
jgi:hypothetical protein